MAATLSKIFQCSPKMSASCYNANHLDEFIDCAEFERVIETVAEAALRIRLKFDRQPYAVKMSSSSAFVVADKTFSRMSARDMSSRLKKFPSPRINSTRPTVGFSAA